MCTSIYFMYFFVSDEDCKLVTRQFCQTSCLWGPHVYELWRNYWQSNSRFALADRHTKWISILLFGEFVFRIQVPLLKDRYWIKTLKESKWRPSNDSSLISLSRLAWQEAITTTGREGERRGRRVPLLGQPHHGIQSTAIVVETYISW